MSDMLGSTIMMLSHLQEQVAQHSAIKEKFSVSKKVREMFGGMREHQSGGNELLKEEVLERFLRTVGYARWIWKDDEPLALSLVVRYLRYLQSRNL